MTPRIVLTAGYDGSAYSISVAESLHRAGVTPTLILIAYPFNLKRVRFLIRSKGLSNLVRYAASGSIGSDTHSPLQKRLRDLQVGTKSLKSWAKANDVPVASVSDLNGEVAVRAVSGVDPDLVIYTGGGILKGQLISAGNRRVLNAHSGPLPQIRGMNAAEWSLLLGQPLCCTIHLIDEGIDTGRELERIPVVPQPGDRVEQLRERCAVAGIDGLTKWASASLVELEPKPRSKLPTTHRQCFVLAPVLRQILDRDLDRRVTASTRCATS